MELHTEDAEKAVAPLTPELDQIFESARRQLEVVFQQNLDSALANAREQVSTEFEQRMRASSELWAEEKGRLQCQVDLWRTYAEAQRQMGEGLSQIEILTHFLSQTEAFAPNLAVYIAKGDGMVLWKSRGEGPFPEVVSQDLSDPDSYFKPVVVRERTVAALCARPPFKAESLDYLLECLARAVEAFGLKLQNRMPKPGTV